MVEATSPGKGDHKFDLRVAHRLLTPPERLRSGVHRLVI